MAAPVSIWERQSLGTDVDSVKNTFSSWDNCMSEAYCKWPAIIGIIIGSLIVLSVVFCLARCLCFGAECCCACFSCCNACCPSPRRRQPRYADPPQQFAPSPYQGYQPPPGPPMYNPQPQYAQFDASRKGPVNEDSLPVMPSWDTASSRKVLEDHKDDDVELGTLDPMHEQTAPMLANQAPTPHVGYGEIPNSTSMPYQQYGAYHGGDLGNPYGQQSYVDHPNPYGGMAAPAQSHGNAGYGYQQGTSSPRQQPAYSAYAASETSTRYEPSSTYAGQELGTAHRPTPAPAAQPLSSIGAPVGRKPLQNTWRNV
ncbi:hypothetical protein MMC17_007438 [Xylographa soralifera]|nr:hypothetical protein [Xylographa soralifera]